MWSRAITVAAEMIPLTAVLLGTPCLPDLVGSADPMSCFLNARAGTVVTNLVSVGSTRRAAYRMPGGPAIPALMLAATAVVCYGAWRADWVPVVVALGIILAGLPYYYLYLYAQRGDRWTLPEPTDEEIA